MDKRKDISFVAQRDSAAKLATYEFKIRRGYLWENCCPDNLLAYSVGLGSGDHRFTLNDEAQNYLKSLGVTEPPAWTYQYVYFGTSPNPLVPTAPGENGDGAGGSLDGDSEQSKMGLIIGLSVGGVVVVAAAAGAAVVLKKKKSK
jgi:hypothetical protein